MLVDFASFISGHSNPRLQGKFYATVINNVDPNQLGYVQIRIPNIIDGTDNALPWAAPQLGSGLGGNKGAQNISVPNVGATVTVEIDSANPYSLSYTGWLPTAQTIPPPPQPSADSNKPDPLHPNMLYDNYPDSYGFIDEKGNGYVVNRATGTTKYGHSSGFQFQITSDGKSTLYLPDELTINGETNITISLKELITILAKNYESTIKERSHIVADIIDHKGNTSTLLDSGGGTSITGHGINLN